MKIERKSPPTYAIELTEDELWGLEYLIDMAGQELWKKEGLSGFDKEYADLAVRLSKIIQGVQMGEVS